MARPSSLSMKHPSRRWVNAGWIIPPEGWERGAGVSLRRAVYALCLDSPLVRACVCMCARLDVSCWAVIIMVARLRRVPNKCGILADKRTIGLFWLFQCDQRRFSCWEHAWHSAACLVACQQQPSPPNPPKPGRHRPSATCAEIGPETGWAVAAILRKPPLSNTDVHPT